MDTQSPPHIPVVIIGGGQAGLSVACQLEPEGHRLHRLRTEREVPFLARQPLGQLLPCHPQLAVSPSGLSL